jgi:hypothetical protein
MIATALVWVSLTALFGGYCLAGTVKQYADSTEVNYWGLAGASIAGGSVVELLAANGYIVETVLTSGVHAVCLTASVAFVVVAFRAHWVDEQSSERQ